MKSLNFPENPQARARANSRPYPDPDVVFADSSTTTGTVFYCLVSDCPQGFKCDGIHSEPSTTTPPPLMDSSLESGNGRLSPALYHWPVEYPDLPKHGDEAPPSDAESCS